MAQDPPKAVHLQLEKAESPTGPWKTVSLSQLPYASDGSLVDVID